MLRHLSVRDFVIVDHVELEFNTGFTVLTGETGAGKSILVDALALALGERADASVVRQGCERAEVIAEFDISGLAATEAWLAENDLAGDEDVCLLRRIVDAGGRSRGFINGRTATMQQLREVGGLLVDIHGQHAHQSLLRQDAQRDLLDGYGGLVNLAANIAAVYSQWHELKQRRLARERDAEQHAVERERLEWQARELKQLAFNSDEWQEQLAEHGRLAHATSLLEGAQYGAELLADGDMALLSQLSGLNARIVELAAHDASLREALDMLEPAEIQLREAAYHLRHYAQRLEIDPERLRQVESRLEAVHSAARKYRVTPEQLPELLAGWERRLSELGGGAEDGEWVKQEEMVRADYLRLAADLSAGRRKAATKLSNAVTDSMQQLAMVGGLFAVALHTLQEGNVHGIEQVEFLVAANAGTEPGALAKVASGGELSRISLSIQVSASQVAGVSTLIFDEVDVGIGGGVAEIVGRLLHKLGAERQVLCVTHLPQVASAGDHHWRVSKTAVGQGVISGIEVLDAKARVDEVARMLGGVEITATTRKHAAEMLGK
jgi:DNA repair protein RecN (Recombination protein N)